MRNFSDKSRRETQNTNSVFSNNPAFMGWCGRIWYSQTCYRWQYNAAQKRCDFLAG